MKYYIAVRTIQINDVFVDIYYVNNAESNLTFDEHQATIAEKSKLEQMLHQTYGVDGWELVRVMYYDSGVLG